MSSNCKSLNKSSKNEDVVKLKKEVGLFGGMALIAGSMIGSGIFLTPAGILTQTGSVGASLCIWAACGVLSTLSALCYIELGLMIQQSGGEYQYLMAAFGDVVGFLFAWQSIIIASPSTFALRILGVGDYLTAPFYPDCNAPIVLKKVIAGSCAVIITTLNCYSVKATNAVQIFITAIKLLIIAAIIVGGFVMLGQGSTEQFNDAFAGTSASFSAIALGFYSGLWPYEGWNQLNVVIEEVKNPLRNLPLAIMIVIPVVTACYILGNIAYFTVMTPNEIMASNAVAVSFGDRVFGPASFLVPISVALSIFGSANGNAFAAGRIVYASGRNGHMWQILSFVNVERCTPSPALIFNCIVTLVMLVPDSMDFYTILDYFTFASWIFRGATFLALIVLRFTKPDWKRPYKVNILIPIICFVTSLWLVVAPILKNPSMTYLYSGLFIFMGLIFYFPFVHFKKTPPFMNALTRFFQTILVVVAPPHIDEDKKE